MIYTLTLPPDTGARAQAQANAQGLAVEEYLVSLIEDALPAPKPRTGAELVALLKKEGIIGMWADREDMKGQRGVRQPAPARNYRTGT